jgi:membrane-associated protein
VWIYAILFLVIFCETGLVVMPFLPGDSLLFIAGAVAAGGGMDPVLLGGLLMLAAIMGDSTNYVIGRTAGERLFSNPNSKIFRRDYLQKTHDFYDKSWRQNRNPGALPADLPHLRAVCCRCGTHAYPRFFGFSVFGTILWVGGLVTLGYFFGNVPFIKKNLSLLVVGIILLSLVPMIIGVARSRLGRTPPKPKPDRTAHVVSERMATPADPGQAPGRP